MREEWPAIALNPRSPAVATIADVVAWLAFSD
jgi:hypothetical protein